MQTIALGKNNKFMLWLLIFYVWSSYFDLIEIRFLITSRTKNVCDGEFGHVKLLFRCSDALYPRETFQSIEPRSKEVKVFRLIT